MVLCLYLFVFLIIIAIAIAALINNASIVYSLILVNNKFYNDVPNTSACYGLLIDVRVYNFLHMRSFLFSFVFFNNCYSIDYSFECYNYDIQHCCSFSFVHGVIVLQILSILLFGNIAVLVSQFISSRFLFLSFCS